MTSAKRRRFPILLAATLLCLVGVVLFITPYGVASYWGSRGDAALRSRQLDLAEQCYAKASSWSPRGGEFTFRRARVARLQAAADRARTLLQQARQQGAPSGKCRREERLLKIQGGRAGEMLGRLPEHLAAAGNDAPAVLEAYAVGLASSGDVLAALEILNRWLERQPDAAIAHFQKGLIHLDLQQTEQAENSLKTALKHDPDLVSARLAMARLAYETKRDDKALWYFRQVAEAEPTNVEARLSMASLLLARNQKQEAIAHFQAVLADHPDSFPARLALASHFAEQQQANEVIELVEPLMERFPEEVSLNYLLATAYQQLGDLEQCELYLQRHLDGRAELDRLLELERNADQGPNDFQVIKQLGMGFLKYEWDSAGRWISLALEMDPRDGDLYASMAILARKRGDVVQAEKYEQAAALLQKHE